MQIPHFPASLETLEHGSLAGSVFFPSRPSPYMTIDRAQERKYEGFRTAAHFFFSCDIWWPSVGPGPRMGAWKSMKVSFSRSGEHLENSERVLLSRSKNMTLMVGQVSLAERRTVVERSWVRTTVVLRLFSPHSVTYELCPWDQIPQDIVILKFHTHSIYIYILFCSADSADLVFNVLDR